MKILIRALSVLAFSVSMAPMLLAQWANYNTPGIPRTPDGKPDLTAPTPKTPDGKPDLTGIWDNGRAAPAGGGARGAAGGPGAAPAGAPGAGRGANAAGPAGPAAGAPAAGAAGPPAGGRGGGQGGARGGGANAGGANPADALPPGAPPANGVIPNASFANAGAGFGGRTLPYQPWAADLVKKRQADNSKDNPDAHCLPMGFMQFHTHPEPRKIVQTKDMVLIIYEANSGLRQIFTDGRKLPNKDAQGWWYGYSVGHWEGDTLVVETTGFLDNNIWLDVQGSPLTDEAKVTEKFRRPNVGTLEIEVTVDDPKAYTRPWTVKVNQRLLADTELIEFICEDRDATHYVGAK